MRTHFVLALILVVVAGVGCSGGTGGGEEGGRTGGDLPHWMRHAHASHALERGASVATTGRYLHVGPERSPPMYLVT